MQQAYLFDEKTKEYKSEVNAQLDPLESEKAGKDIYLLPANATWEQPPIKEGYTTVWNGKEWDAVEDNRKKEYWLPEDKYGAPAREMKELGPLPEGAMLTAPERTLEEVKAAKIAELKAERDTREVEPITYNGNSYDYDDKARERMRIAQQALSDNNIPNQLWTTYDNTQVELTVQDFKNINTLAAKRSGELHIHYNTLKQEVLACTTNEDVEKIEW